MTLLNTCTCQYTARLNVEPFNCCWALHVTVDAALVPSVCLFEVSEAACVPFMAFDLPFDGRAFVAERAAAV